MKKLITLLLVLSLSGCLIEEKHYHGCDVDSKTDPSADTIDVPDTATDTDAKEFFDLFEEATATK